MEPVQVLGRESESPAQAHGGDSSHHSSGAPGVSPGYSTFFNVEGLRRWLHPPTLLGRRRSL